MLDFDPDASRERVVDDAPALGDPDELVERSLVRELAAHHDGDRLEAGGAAASMPWTSTLRSSIRTSPGLACRSLVEVALFLRRSITTWYWRPVPADVGVYPRPASP